MKKNWLGIVVAAVGVVSGVAVILEYVRGEPGPAEPTRSVRATGDRSIAAGNDVRIGEKTTVNEHDFDDDLRQKAEGYLKVARDRCKNVSGRIASLTADSAIDMMDMQRFYPPEMYPSEIVAQHYGEQVHRDINTKLEQTLQTFQVAVKPLLSNSIHSMTGFAQRPEEKQRNAASFPTDKQAWLDSTNELCSYLDSVGT